MKLPHIHWWKRFMRLIPDVGSCGTIFRIRTCRCGKVQVKNDGIIGDGRWEDVEPKLMEMLSRSVPYSYEF
jgi:hypothetical protein